MRNLSDVRQKYFNSFFILFFLLNIGLSCGKSAEQRIAEKKEASQKIGTEVYAPDGMAVFRKYCVACHGSDGKLGLSGAKDLTQSVLTIEERTMLVKQGKNLMTPFGDILSPQEISAVVDYTMTLKK